MSRETKPSSSAAQPLVVLAGPTASGKSDVALALAEMLGAEIVSVDSMQVYRGMDIGTAKPSAAVRKRVPHHLIDIASLSQPFDAAQFARLARQAVAGIHQRGRAAILCGGTGLYFRAFFEGVGAGPAANRELRKELQDTAPDKLLDELQRRDPATFRVIDRSNPRRIIRAVEVIRQIGRPFSEQKDVWSPLALPNALGLCRDKQDLHDRINVRVDQMFAQGLVHETRELLNRGLAENTTAMQALGYRQVVEHLQGKRSLDDTIALVKLRTRQFAKRQMTWFRRQMALQWVTISADESAAETTVRIAAALTKP